MKYLLLLTLLLFTACKRGEAPNTLTRISGKALAYNVYEYRVSGMRYVIFTNVNGGMTAVNVTLDSLKLLKP